METLKWKRQVKPWYFVVFFLISLFLIYNNISSVFSSSDSTHHHQNAFAIFELENNKPQERERKDNTISLEPSSDSLGNDFSKELSFGPRHSHRLAHVAARSLPLSGGDLPFLTFDPALVHPQFRNTTVMEVEATYFRFRDQFGLINTDWSDEQVISALQRLVDIYAKANIHIRIRPKEALAYVDLSEERAKAYWYYVDYPKGNSLSQERQERKDLMDRVIGKRLIAMFERTYKDRNGLLDWILGWPLERTPWENENVVGIYPTYFYYYMNGGGETNCMRFRTGDCTRPKHIQLPPPYPQDVYTMCYHLEVGAVNTRGREKEHPVVRSWERFSFTPEMAVRLVAHEFGHALKLQHLSGKACLPQEKWSEGNLMSQVRQVTAEGLSCTAVGHPDKAVEAIALFPVQIEAIRENLRKDLRESPLACDRCIKIGKTIEIAKEERCTLSPVSGFTVALKARGVIRRIRWKSAKHLAHPIRVSLGQFDSTGRWSEDDFTVVDPHHSGSHIHQEHNVHLVVNTSSLFLGVFSHLDNEDLAPQVHFHDNVEDVLTKDIASNLPIRMVPHEIIGKVLNSVDTSRIKVSRAPTLNQRIQLLDSQVKWKTVQCPEFVFNYDLESIE